MMAQTFELWIVLNGQPGILAMFLDANWCQYVADMFIWAGATEAAQCVPGEAVEISKGA